jgi:hypothetical protein
MPVRSGWVSPEFNKVAEANNDFYGAFAFGCSLSARRAQPLITKKLVGGYSLPGLIFADGGLLAWWRNKRQRA